MAFLDITNPLIINLVIALASLIVVAKSADLLVYGISNYAQKLGISYYIIGFVVVSIGTALPELITAINGAIIGQGEIIFGTIIGSNLFKIPLLGIILALARNIKTKPDAAGNAPIITFFIIMLPLFLVADGTLSRIDGVVLVISFLIYVLRLWQGEGELGKIKEKVEIKDIYKDGLVFLGSLVALLLSARWLVFSSIKISELMNISPFIIGFIVIGIGASTPEVMVQVRSVIRHHSDMAFGNVLGSLVANSALVLGIAAIIRPFSIGFSTILTTAIFLAAGVLFVLTLTTRQKVTWRHGIALISLYVIALAVELVF